MLTDVAVQELSRQAIWVMLKIGAPVMGIALLVGLVVSLLQALTQVQEMTLTFVPKLLGAGLVLSEVVLRIAGFEYRAFPTVQFGWPRPAALIGFVLAGNLEQYLFISVQRYGLGWLTRPGVIIMAIIIIASLSASIVYQKKFKTAGRTAAKD